MGGRSKNQMPTVAFVIEPEYFILLNKKAEELGMTRSDYLRRIVTAVITSEVEEDAGNKT